MEMTYVGHSKKQSLYLLSSQSRIRGKNDKNILFSHFFLVSQKSFMKTFRPSQNLFKASQSVKIKVCHFLFQLINLGCMGQEGLIKFFLLAFSYLKKW